MAKKMIFGGFQADPYKINGQNVYFDKMSLNRDVLAFA
jgi:hypothetical protein